MLGNFESNNINLDIRCIRYGGRCGVEETCGEVCESS